MNVKRILRWTLALVCLLPILSVMAQDSTSTAEPAATMEAAPLPDLGGRTVTVAIENAYPPFNFLDTTTGQPLGWDYDTINEICSRLNCVPDFIQVSWEGMIVAVAGGEYDMAADGISITEERAKQVDYSIPYITTIQRLMLRKDDDRYTSVQAFVDDPEAKIASQLATTNYELAKNLIGEDRLIGTADFGSAIQSLIAGDVDGVIIDDVAGQGYVGANSESIKLLPDELSSDPLGFIYPKGSDLREPFDAALQSMMADKSLARISAFWGLGAPVDDIATVLTLQAEDTKSPEFTVLLAAVKQAGLTEALADPSATLTVFAPTDAAFGALSKETIDAIHADPALLTSILTYHVLPAAVTSNDLASGDVTSLEGSPLTVAVDADGNVTINGAHVVIKDIKATNGVIHVIDAVLVPADVTLPTATEQP